ncbi:acyl dehydratase [Azospirillum lipoferum]|uniref:MaoC family dehydratase n=1 Tax=Azospirillum lipoferum TaxID=193 RepID=A0A5A9GMM8_AZOLI|nr:MULTISPECIES: MaoC family dehydratase [Azospirillum]KAA0595661.1 MaoC family dehydratase [Azospirillum lipoferum]MCP1611476.1 acyl dehydratase [Azospirillum lipoferum]MDW5537278.1 MaoC family dehydratase [Azospirillum sp. NL1]
MTCETLSPLTAMKARPRERFSCEVALSLSEVTKFADSVGDNNPIHHDIAYAATTRFGRPTASGPHATSLLLALTASHFSKKGAMLGLEFWIRFRRPIYADETIRLEWLVRKVAWNEKLRGEIVDLRGRIKGQDGKTSLAAKGRVLLTDRL